MKLSDKIFAITAILVLMAFSGCQKGSSLGECGQECLEKLTVELPQEVVTRAVSQAGYVDIVYYDVWSEDFGTLLFSGTGSVDAGVAVIDVALVKDQNYKFIFWAQSESANSAYSWSNLKRIEVDYSKFTANNKDCYDAFYAVEPIAADGKNKTVHLYRVFAQLNFGASTMSASFGDFEVTENTVTVSKYARAFDTVKGCGVDYVNAPVTFSAPKGGLVQDESSDHKDLKVGQDAYFWVAMNYMLVPAEDKATVVVDASFKTEQGTVEHKIINVPLSKNYRTNIVGDLFTSSSQLKIVVEKGFEKPDENKYLNK